MRRPLAVFGFGVFFTLLAATRLPAGFLLPAALVFLGLAGACLLRFGRGAAATLPLLLAAAGLSLLWLFGYGALAVQPALRLAGKEAAVTARVEDAQPGYAEDTALLTLRTLTIEGKESAPALKLQVSGLPPFEIGDVIGLSLRFYDLSGRDSAPYSRAKGIFVGAQAVSPAELLGHQNTFLGQMRRFQYAAGDNIREKLPLRLSSVAAAMSVGDKRFLSRETTEAYRTAGLSHMLVVSGLHLAILCGLLYRLAFLLCRRRRVASALCMAGVFLFMVFTGLSPSILRSGIACLLVYTAVQFQRKADIYTSLGFAALLLCLQNPYAAADAGLQLSITATLGVMLAGGFTAGLRRRVQAKTRPGQAALALAGAALTPLCVSLATLPVIALNGFGFSLWALPMNLIALPLLAPIVLCGFVMALPGGLFPAALLARPAAFIAGALLAFLEKLTAFCARFPAAGFTLGGLFAFTAILLAYLLVFLAFRTGRRAAFLSAAALMLPAALALHLFLDAGTVRLSLVGSGSASSLVVSRGGQAAVLYRGSPSDDALHRAFQRQNINDCVLWVDLRQNPQGTQAESYFQPNTLFLASRDLQAREILSPFEQVDIYLLAQGGGTLACVDVEGYKVGVASGSVNLADYPPLDVLIPAEGTVQGEFGSLLVAGPPPEWAGEGQPVLASGGSAQLLIRPGKSVIFREAEYDIFS